MMRVIVLMEHPTAPQSQSLQINADNNFSQQQVIVCIFLIVAVTQLWLALYTYKHLFIWLISGPVTALKWLQMTLLTSSNQ